MKLEDIGFYTLSDARAAQTSHTSPLMRCEMILTSRCNFKCPYCRHVGGKDLSAATAINIIELWAKENLKNIRFSGGEPTLHKDLPFFVKLAKELGIERIALSTNGSADMGLYERLIELGVNDISVSLDACCAEDGDRMAGGVKGAWETVVANIRALATLTYVTVGVVLTEANKARVNDIIRFAHELGVTDIRVIPAAQDDDTLRDVTVDEDLLTAHPILRYRIRNVQQGVRVRGLGPTDTGVCMLALDDMASMNDKHYPCIIYMREGGKPIGTIGQNVRVNRYLWVLQHDSHDDPICSKNCLDVCVHYNNRAMAYALNKAVENGVQPL